MNLGGVNQVYKYLQSTFAPKREKVRRETLKFITLMMIATIACVGCSNTSTQESSESSTSVESPDDLSLQEKIDQLVRFSKGEETLFPFTAELKSEFSVAEHADWEMSELTVGTLGARNSYLGWCLQEESKPFVQFEVKINSNFPLDPWIEWAFVTESGLLYGDSGIIPNAQPNSLSLFTEEGLPTMNCENFKPVALMFTMEDTDYFYQYFYKVVANRFEKGSKVWWQYNLVENIPYRVPSSARYFTF